MDFQSNPPKMTSVLRPLEDSVDVNNGVLPSPVTALAFHNTSPHLFIACNKSITLHNVLYNNTITTIKTADKAASSPLAATHCEYNCLIATRKHARTHEIQYLSLYDNKCLRTFAGHSDEIVDISMCPVDDNFLTASRDGTVRLWDVKSAACAAKMDLTTENKMDPRSCHAVYDHTGLVFCISAQSKDSNNKGHCVHLYDARNYSGGAFAEMQVSHASIRNALQLQLSSTVLGKEDAEEMSSVPWSKVQFNASGKQLLVTAKRGLVMMLDGFDASVGHVFLNDTSAVTADENVAPGSGAIDMAPSACFSSDDQTILVGGYDGVVRCYSATSGAELSRLEGHPTGSAVGCVACSPNLAVVATSCVNTALWTWSS
mmetsp:Transcript_20386/g.31176  ORF Transcript_20386/g.31176 Transcript_20386/m.31176 type:complete len:373 (-) Transcript_20386:1617-2735(-)